jgi:hypothetical protein
MNDIANMASANSNGNDGDDDDDAAADVIVLADGTVVPRVKAARDEITKGEAWQSKETKEDHLKRLLDELEEDDDPSVLVTKKEPEKKKVDVDPNELRALLMAALKK